MIPTVEEILLGLAAGRFTHAQAMAWMEQHFDMAMEQAQSEKAATEAQPSAILPPRDLGASAVAFNDWWDRQVAGKPFLDSRVKSFAWAAWCAAIDSRR